MNASSTSSTIPARGYYKRFLDLAVLAAAHAFFLPLCIILWIGIPLALWLEDQGPPLYRQRRVGKDGKAFTMLKFRTMIVDAEKSTGAIWSTADDPRITRTGRMLRATALDELPQIINILRGEMSFVGPRAERPELHEKILQEVPGFSKRLTMRPGLTGLAQISGEYDLDPRTKLKYDLEYAKRMSPILDIKLLLASVWNTLTARWDQPKKTLQTNPHDPPGRQDDRLEHP